MKARPVVHSESLGLPGEADAYLFVCVFMFTGVCSGFCAFLYVTVCGRGQDAY